MRPRREQRLRVSPERSREGLRYYGNPSTVGQTVKIERNHLSGFWISDSPETRETSEHTDRLLFHPHCGTVSQVFIGRRCFPDTEVVPRLCVVVRTLEELRNRLLENMEKPPLVLPSTQKVVRSFSEVPYPRQKHSSPPPPR